MGGHLRRRTLIVPSLPLPLPTFPYLFKASIVATTKNGSNISKTSITFKPQKALCGGIPDPFLEPLTRTWSHFVGIYRQKLTKSSKNDF